MCDVIDEESVKEAVRLTAEHFGKIDILINSAGINIRGAIENLSVKDFNAVQQVNVTGSWLACREVVPIMKKEWLWKNYKHRLNAFCYSHPRTYTLCNQ